MNARLVNSAAGVILAALTQNRTAAGIALALDSAQLLLTPEIAAELAELRARDAALLTVMDRVRDMHRSVTDVDGRPTAPGCSVWGLLSDLATVRGLNRAPEHNQWSGEPYPPEVPADRLTATFAAVQVLREDPHDGPLVHSYRTSRDLPRSGDAL